MENELQTELDWSEAKELIGASDKQIAFARAIVEKGASRTAAARAAGYSGTDNALRAVASRAYKSGKVQSLFAWAKAGGAGVPDEPGDLKELERILWRHARGQDKAHSIKASQILHSLQTTLDDKYAWEQGDGVADERMMRDVILDGAHRTPDLVASFVLRHAPTYLGALPLLHDVYPIVKEHWPEIWDKLLARHSPEMRETTEKALADPTWGLEYRKKIWGEKGFVIDDGAPKRDPLGRAVIKVSEPQ